jgi:uncharacterized protein (TIGR02646 family)
MRLATCRDQGELCVYCERRIRPIEGSTYIEHWQARSTGEGVFRWTNLLGVCSGGSGDVQHCDRARPANTELFLHPVEGLGPSPRRYLKYLAGGELAPTDSAPAEVKRDIKYLHLNAEPLKRARSVVFDSLRSVLDAEGFSSPALRRELRRHTMEPGKKLPEQSGLARYQLERWLRKKEAVK